MFFLKNISTLTIMVALLTTTICASAQENPARLLTAGLGFTPTDKDAGVKAYCSGINVAYSNAGRDGVFSHLTLVRAKGEARSAWSGGFKCSLLAPEKLQHSVAYIRPFFGAGGFKPQIGGRVDLIANGDRRVLYATVGGRVFVAVEKDVLVSFWGGISAGRVTRNLPIQISQSTGDALLQENWRTFTAFGPSVAMQIALTTQRGWCINTSLEFDAFGTANAYPATFAVSFASAKGLPLGVGARVSTLGAPTQLALQATWGFR